MEFRLAADVPAHAEHVLKGESNVESLRFESPMLQKGDIESYQFILRYTYSSVPFLS